MRNRTKHEHNDVRLRAIWSGLKRALICDVAVWSLWLRGFAEHQVNKEKSFLLDPSNIGIVCELLGGWNITINHIFLVKVLLEIVLVTLRHFLVRHSISFLQNIRKWILLKCNSNEVKIDLCGWWRSSFALCPKSQKVITQINSRFVISSENATLDFKCSRDWLFIRQLWLLSIK